MANKLGRNKPCHCGSGEKYKNCHLTADKGDSSKRPKTSLSTPMHFENLLPEYNSIQLLALLGALQLYPENHGRNFRFEQMCLQVLRQFDPEDARPTVSEEQIRNAIENYRTGAEQEDPLANLHCEIAIFEQGNYRVYPGIYNGFTEILNQLTTCIFLHENSLNEVFVQEVRDAVGLLLFMSESAAESAGSIPLTSSDEHFENVLMPSSEEVSCYARGINFKRERLTAVCEQLGYNIGILKDFTVQPKAEELNNDDPEENVVNFKPVIAVGESYVLYMPTGVLNSLINYIYREAKEHNCYEELMELLYDWQFHLACSALAQTGWLATDIKLPEPAAPMPVKEAVFQFDNQKLAYISYLKSGQLSGSAVATSTPKVDRYEDRTKEVVGYLTSLEAGQPFAVFCLYIIAETASEYFFSWSQPSADNQSLSLKISELMAIIQSDVDGLALWKFAKCFNRTNERLRVMSLGGLLDAYAIYRENNGSLLDSDGASPIGGMLMIISGSSNEFRKRVKKQQHKHAVPMFFDGRIAHAKVTRHRDFAPIYIEREASRYFRIALESYVMPIWITNPQTSAYQEGWGTYFCEAIAFWLYRLQPELSEHIDGHRLLQFEIEILLAEELMQAGKFLYKEVDPRSIELSAEVASSGIRLQIPLEFIYSIMLADNTADRMLLQAVLEGLAGYITECGYETDLDKALIAAMIERTLLPPQAKMILFSDAAGNIKMDDRDLPPVRFITETDVSFVLDNLVGYLPKGYVIPENILDRNGKIKLCDDIVSALVVQITERLQSFEGSGLLRWLIKLNEKCIQLREYREIDIPAKIACFSDFDTEVQKLLDGEKNIVTTAHATRTLIEFVASGLPHGSKWPNFDDIDELLALTNQLTEWGSLSEAIRMGIDNPEMGLLPSGRIGTEKTVEQEAFKPYAVAKTESALFQNMEDFESNYVTIKKEGPINRTKEMEGLDAAFRAEYGVSLTAMTKIIGALANEGFERANSCMEINETRLNEILTSVDRVDANDIKNALDLLTLLERDGIGQPPKGFTPNDIFPWRYNRPISYIRRPLVRINKDNVVYYFYGYRHLIQFVENLMSLLHSSKLPGAKTEEMISWLAGASGKKGNPFREEVKIWFEQHSDFQVVPYEVQMDNKVPKGHIRADKHYGDIDLLVIDHNQKVIYSIECKNIQGGRNVHEMKVEMDDYLGREGKGKKAKILKHLKRHEWLDSNKDGLNNLVPGADGYAVKSFILTADEIALSYLRKDDLPLPVKSFAFLRKNGIGYLSDLA
jgi:hypothetical protein